MTKKIINNNIGKGEVVLYKSKDGKFRLDVKLDKETVWLSQLQMAELFNKGLSTINEHIKNVYREKELSRASTIRKSRIVQFEGGRQVERLVELYNLDVIISVGYRVKSNRGTQFRIWATKVLKEHLITGYTVNQKRLLEQKDKLLELQRAIKIIQEKSQPRYFLFTFWNATIF